MYVVENRKKKRGNNVLRKMQQYDDYVHFDDDVKV